MTKLKSFIARLLFPDLIQSLENSIKQLESLTVEREKKNYIRCPNFDINSDKFLNFAVDLMENPMFIFMTKLLQDEFVDIIKKSNKDDVVEMRGCLKGLSSYDNFLIDRKAFKLKMDAYKKREAENA